MSRDYHLNKTLRCRESGYRLLHLNETLMHNYQRLRALLSSATNRYDVVLSARECDIADVSSEKYRRFCETSHASGSAPASVRIGLRWSGELVSVMSFARPRFSKKHDYELVRLCTKSGYLVRGGASRMLARFRTTMPSASIISYCDNFFSGKVYEKLGFTYSHRSPPSYAWYHRAMHNIVSRYAAQKHRLWRVRG